MYPLEEIEEYVKEKTKNVKLITHAFDHLKRVAIGARWFVKILDGSKKEQELAYIAGLLHDVVRLDTEKIPHSEASAEKAKKILRRFQLNREDVDKITLAIRNHSKPVEWKSVLHQSVFLADKIFELMGGYVVFRRSMYIGECRDYKNLPFKEAMLSYWPIKLKLFTPRTFPKIFRRLVEKRYEIPAIFFEELKKEREWAINLARKAYENGRNHELSLEEFIKEFKPNSEEEWKIKKDALNYIEHMKNEDLEEFEELIEK